MGTNYYIVPRGPARVIFPKTIHVGKKSHGWSFSFRGYTQSVTSLMSDEIYDNSVAMLLNSRSEIKSRADWVRVLEKITKSHTRVFFNIVNEYGAHVSDPVDWCRQLPAPTHEQLVWERSREARGAYTVDFDANPREWHDTELFRFFDGEFS